MQKRYLIFIVLMLLSAPSLGWEPYQAAPTKVSLQYKLFAPFNDTEVKVEVNDKGYIQQIFVETEIRKFSILADHLKSYRYPSLADIEIMSYGEKDEESGLGGSFSLCIPYGNLKDLEREGYWQRPVIEILVSPNMEKVINIPPPQSDSIVLGANGCEVAAKEVYGF